MSRKDTKQIKHENILKLTIREIQVKNRGNIYQIRGKDDNRYTQLVRLWGIGHSHTLTLRVQTRTTFLRVRPELTKLRLRS